MPLPVDPQLFGAFFAVTLLLVVTPGPAILFALASGVAKGRRGALLATAGMTAANLVWFAAAALGLAAVAKTHAGLFGLLRYLGVAYLLWLAAQKFAAAMRRSHLDSPGRIRHAERPLRDGFLVQITNPKALVYITAILPPFVDAARPIGVQLALFAATSVLLDVVFMIAYGFGGAALASRMAEPRFRRGFDAFTALLLLAAALMILTRH
jgi:threonine/homoserine/homoserine lactone efflux protein